MDWHKISASLADQFGGSVEIRNADPVSGGDISSAFHLLTDAAELFLKINSSDKLAMFELEMSMLNELASHGGLRVPTPYGCGVADGLAYIVMEYIPLAPGDDDGAARLGTGLAGLHQHHSDHFGWPQEGYLGVSRQPNQASDNWVEFWRDQRLGFQLRLAQRNGLPPGTVARLQLLLELLPQLFSGYRPVPSLLHGDLWHGNWAVDKAGAPVIFDPACYYGDAEADLALCELFGGFSESFFSAYWRQQGRDPGYELRSQLYQLYHLLNHFNLFGSHYAERANGMIERILAEVGH